MTSQDIQRLAAACAAQLETGTALSDAGPAFSAALAALLDAIRQSDPRYAFDRDGRPGAVAAIRNALPAIERELLAAVIEDHACEIAALQEALYQLALATHAP